MSAMEVFKAMLASLSDGGNKSVRSGNVSDIICTIKLTQINVVYSQQLYKPSMKTDTEYI